jgi:hypothetical protein
MVGTEELTAGRGLRPFEQVLWVVQRQWVIDRRSQPWIEAKLARLGVALAVVMSDVEMDFVSKADDLARVRRKTFVDQDQVDIGTAAQHGLIVHDRADDVGGQAAIGLGAPLDFSAGRFQQLGAGEPHVALPGANGSTG